MERRTATISTRQKPSVKKFLLSEMKKDGFNNFTDWFEQFVQQMMDKKKRSKKRR